MVDLVRIDVYIVDSAFLDSFCQISRVLHPVHRVSDQVRCVQRCARYVDPRGGQRGFEL